MNPLLNPSRRATTDACIPARRGRDPVAATPLSEDYSISKVPFGAGYSGAWVQMRSNGARPPRRVPPPRAEERYEFDRLRDQFNPTQLRGFAAAVRAAQAIAPTHPHPGVESASKNMLAGPMAAVVDRVRDMIRNARDNG